MKGRGKSIFSAYRQVVRRRVRFFQRCLSVCLAVCVAYLLWYRWDSREIARKNQELQAIALQAVEAADAGAEEADGEKVQAAGTEAFEEDPVPGAETDDSAENSGQDTGNEEEKGSDFMAGFDQLARINPDLKGWISIPGTVLSLPVVQCGDNSWYLGHDFYGKQDRHGTIYVDCEADLEAGGFNVVIYGHHMRDGSMFGILKEYRNEAFYREHPSFFISLPEEKREYEIVAVVRNDIFEGNGEAFQYYDYKQISNEEDFAEYCQALKDNAVYDTGVEVTGGDELVTLCTCDYGSTDQRLLVVGRKKTDKTGGEDGRKNEAGRLQEYH